MAQTPENTAEFVKNLKFDAQNLIPAIIQDHKNGDVLMMAFMNEEAVTQTLEGPHVVFYSRSKQKLWKKGESSGHTQVVHSIAVDCDQDCLLIRVEQKVAACHKGFRSCFYREWQNGELVQVSDPIFNTEKVYS